MSEGIPVECEVAYARAERQEVVRVRLPAGATAMDALRASGLLERFREIDVATVRLGVFGRVVAPDQGLVSGDRVEVYRPLTADPRVARRTRARRAR